MRDEQCSFTSDAHLFEETKIATPRPRKRKKKKKARTIPIERYMEEDSRPDAPPGPAEAAG